jgi:thiol-disulfide isomerase/thioredoxin
VSNRPNRKDIPGHQVAKASGGTPTWIWLAAAAVVVVAVVVAVLLSSSNEGADDLTVGTVSVSGSVLPEYGGQQPDPAVGMMAPVLNGENFAGEPVTVGGTGTPQVVVFLAHWCPVCQREVPVITKWAEDNPDLDGVEVVAVATGIDRTRGNYPPGAWLRSENWPYEPLVDNADHRSAEVYGLTSFPYFVAIDAEGKVVGRVSAEIGSEGLDRLVEGARTGTTVVIQRGGTTPVE